MRDVIGWDDVPCIWAVMGWDAVSLRGDMVLSIIKT